MNPLNAAADELAREWQTTDARQPAFHFTPPTEDRSETRRDIQALNNKQLIQNSERNKNDNNTNTTD